MKRFYKLVSTHQEEGGWAVHLDGSPVKTPMRTKLLAANEAIANELVKEWAAQEETIDPETMPLTQILSTQIDRISAQRTEMSAAICKYLNTDLLCYRADPEPPSPAEKQAEIWDQWLQWFEDRFECPLKTTTGLSALQHDEAAHKAVQTYINALDDARFNILQLVVSSSGSLVLGLAFAERAIIPDQVMQAARVEENLKDEIYNADLHGKDPLQEKKDAAMLRDLIAAETYLKLL